MSDYSEFLEQCKRKFETADMIESSRRYDGYDLHTAEKYTSGEGLQVPDKIPLHAVACDGAVFIREAQQEFIERHNKEILALAAEKMRASTGVSPDFLNEKTLREI